MKSLIQALAQIGKEPPFSIGSDFQSYPSSLIDIFRILYLPAPLLASLEHRKVYNFTENESQGLTFAHDDIWFLSSKMHMFKYKVEGTDLYRPVSIDRIQKEHLVEDLLASTDLNKDYYDHIGDIDCFEDIIFAPVRSTNKTTIPNIVIAMTTSLEVIGYSYLSINTADSCCAVNRWTKRLYMPRKDRSDILDAYDISGFYQQITDREKWGERVETKLLNDQSFHLYKEVGIPDYVNGFQGIVFSENGRLYVARCDGDGPWYNYIHVYNSLTGMRLSVSPEYDFKGWWDEIEGLSIHPSGVIYVAVNDNDYIFDTDEFQIHAFKYTDASFPT